MSSDSGLMPMSDPHMAGAAHVIDADATPIEDQRNLDTILQIPVTVQVVLGSTSMPVANLMKLGPGAVVALDRRVGEPVEIMVNGRLVARGEMMVLEGDKSRFGVSLTEVVGAPGRGA